jgi:hypothetical protein
MGIEERIKSLENEFPTLRDEFKVIILDIRIKLMEMYSPLQWDMEADKHIIENNPGKGVRQHGNE